jgi:SAM-dependent methyltransferase
MILYAATLFTSAFLLFLVQPLIAKYILPWFGGGPGVWTACLLFFQVLLTAGYGYAHLLADRFSRRTQVTIAISFLLLSIASLPITPSKAWAPQGALSPTWQIVKLLFISVGACYFLLSSTAPLLQSWFSRVWPGASPYRLYALSNLGSLLAIISYPFVIEPRLGLYLQTRLWSWSYVAFAVLCGACALKLRKTPAAPALPDDGVASPRTLPSPIPGPAHGLSDRIMWLILPAFSSILLMATTNQLCLDIAVVPLLWLLPMGLYLLSFILCFHSERWYSRLGYGIALAAALAQTCVVLDQGIYIGLKIQIISYCFTLFVCCMVCHGELVRLKPASRHLTSFYLMISAGGAFGGVFVSLAAPHLFKAYWEYHLGLAGTAFLFLIILFRDPHGYLFEGRPPWAWAFLGFSFLALLMALGIQIRGAFRDTLAVKRNFFGVLRVLEDNKQDPLEHRTILMHGRIEHGYQFSEQDKRHWPTSYFGPNSGVGIAIRYHPRRIDPALRHLRIGVVGLGTGTLAAYGEDGDYFRFYEINPDVLELSNAYFTYCKDTRAQVDVVLGDARISMEHEKGMHQAGQFDVLAVDAFSSDAIPVHLLTRECYRDYWYHLKKDGILALHISSRYFNLRPVIRNLAESDFERRPQAVLVDDPGDTMQETDATRWVLITSNKEFLDNVDVRAAISPWASEDTKRLIFTDDYSNLFSLLK